MKEGRRLAEYRYAVKPGLENEARGSAEESRSYVHVAVGGAISFPNGFGQS